MAIIKKQMKKINLIVIICLILCSCQNNNEQLEVFPVEKINSSNPDPNLALIPVMNGSIFFIAGKNTPKNATYRMYFDTSENPKTVFDLTTTEKKYTNLKINKTYYWRVETIGVKGEVLASSPIWNFTTDNKIIVRTQKDLELLGSNKYSKIEGTLVIGDLFSLTETLPPPTDISDLSPLSDLTHVVKLVINNNNSLINLNGLSNLKVIYNDLFIGQGQNLSGGNSSLVDISALSKIQSLNGTLIIYNNNKLKNLNGLELLKSIRKDLVIEDNSILNNFCALTTLFNNTGLSENYYVKNNKYNPTKKDLIEKRCNN